MLDFWAGLLSGLGGVVFLWWALGLSGRLSRPFGRGPRLGRSRHRRGRQFGRVGFPRRLFRVMHGILTEGRFRPCLKIGSVRIPRVLEPYHLLLAGSPGSGKSVAIQACLETLRERGDRVLVADCGGESLARFYRPGDRILNPLDGRSMDWSPLAEMQEGWDAERLARSLVPERDGADREWHHYAQSLIAGVLERLWITGSAQTGGFVDALTQASNADLAALVAGHPCQSLFEEGAQRMLASVRGIVGTYLAPYRFLDRAVGAEGFSIRKWVARAPSPDWLFLTYRDDQATVLRPLLAAWLDLAVGAILAREPDPLRRIWIVLDELGALGTVPVLADALTRGRKYGLACLAGVQTLRQLYRHYGRDGALILLSCFGSLLVLRTQEAETAEHLSRELGEREIIQRELGFGRGGATHSDRRHLERIVLASEIQNLEDRRGFLARARGCPVESVYLPVRERRLVAETFVPNPSLGDHTKRMEVMGEVPW
ncbi:MAG: type IV secretion system DNA-binding domain-containing protein [Gammaproteobacteria bacterium]